MTIFGDGNQVRAFTYIDDIAAIIARSVDYPAARNQVFNVGSALPCLVNALATLIARVMGKECRVVHLDERKEVKGGILGSQQGHRRIWKPGRDAL